MYIATEVPPFHADVLVSDGKIIIECEVKLTSHDLKNDFKKRKHRVYNDPYAKWHYFYRPNKMFYAVPYSMIEYAKEHLPDKYGIIGVNDKPLHRDISKTYCSVIRQAKPITLDFSDKLLHKLILRSSSELLRIRLRYNMNDQIKRILSLYRRIKEKHAKLHIQSQSK